MIKDFYSMKSIEEYTKEDLYRDLAIQLEVNKCLRQEIKDLLALASTLKPQSSCSTSNVAINNNG